MVPKRRDAHTLARERALIDAVAELADELRLVDVADLVAFIRAENHPNINDLVNSSLELLFKPDVLRYGWGAEIELTWETAPAIMLDMEFRHLSVTVFFRLVLRALTSGVDLHYISFENPSGVPGENTQRLVDAIADARLAPRQDTVEAAIASWAGVKAADARPEQRL